MIKIIKEISVNPKLCVKYNEKDLKDTKTDVHIAIIQRTLNEQEFSWIGCMKIATTDENT